MTQAFNLSQLANFVNSSGLLDASAINGTVTYASNANRIANASGWNVTPTGSKLYFNFNGTNVASLDSSGNFITLGSHTASGTP
jgi:hypothetical protein